ncbi:hypothetical protein VN97_g10851 [Penicillium thymicola]|uniref:Uncharacterized protein n=1 Tax=Penicillium thymicola TaxID=293382 RepID=A0AAI9X3R5_PENTH|nr:hypothetical protein VN97_g10851 [Penicillium thymicola]
MALFSVHMRVLEKASICMKKLLELDGENRKRGQGCANPLEGVLKGLYTAERNVYDEYQIQTTNGWRTIRAPFEDRQELSCRQLWLFVMRHDDPAALGQGHLAYMAKQLGFYSALIEVDAAKHEHVSHDQVAESHPATWTDDSSVSIDERLGQKGGRWLTRTKQARNHLFFDVAETIGTKAAQKFQKLITVTPLVELACIYRALFGDPFSPSKYAEIPRAEGHASSGSLAKAKTSSELSPPLREPSDCGHGSENESIYYDALIVPCGDPPMTASERPEEEQNNLEGHSYLQLRKVAESGDSPAGSYTQSQIDFAEPEIYGNGSPGRSIDFSIMLQPETNGVPAASRTLNDRCLTEPDRQGNGNLGGHSYLQLCEVAENGDPPAGSSTPSHRDFAEPQIDGDRSPGRSTDFSIVLQPETNGVPAASRTLNDRCLMQPDRQGNSNFGGHSFLQVYKAVERGDPPPRTCILNDGDFDEPQIGGDRSPGRSTDFSIVLQPETNGVPAASHTLNDRYLAEPARQGDSSLEGYSYLQLCKAAESGGPPAGSSTQSQIDFAEPEIYGNGSPGRSTFFSIVLQSNRGSAPAASHTLNDRYLTEPDRQGDSNLEGYSYLQLCKAAESGGPPAGSSTPSHRDFAEPQIDGDRSPGRSTFFSIVLQSNRSSAPAASHTLNDRYLMEPDRQGDSNLEGYSYLQLCKAAESGGPPAGSSTPSQRGFAEPQIDGDRSPGRSTDLSIVLQPETSSVPAASRTLNNRSLKEPETHKQYFSEICAVNSFSPVESKAVDRSVSPSSTSSPITGSVQATGNGDNLHYHGDSSAGSIVSNSHSIIAPAIQGDGSAEISTSTSSYDIPGDFQADRLAVSEVSPFSPMAGLNWTGNTLRWLDLARLHQPLRIPPTVEGFCVTYPPLTRSLPMLRWNGATVTSLEPSTKIQIQEQVDWREIGENDGANQRDCLNYLESVVADSPPISAYPVEEMRGRQHYPAAVAVNLGKNGLLEQNSPKAQDTSEYVASTSGHKDQVERIRQTQPQSHSSKTARAEPEEIHSLQQSEPVKTTYRSDPFSIGFPGSGQEHLPTSLLGDISQHRDCMSLFSPSSCSDGESDLEGGVLNTADATMSTKDTSTGSATSSAKSIKAHYDPIVTSNERCQPLVSQNPPHMALLAPCGQDYSYIDHENQHRTIEGELNTMKDGGFDHYLSSQMSRTSTLPSHVTRTVSDRTAAGQEQLGKSAELAECTRTGFWCPRAPPTDPESHSGKYFQGRHGIADSRSLQTVVENVNEDFAATTGQPGNRDLPQATKLGHDICTSPYFQEDNRFVQDKATRVSDRELQQQLSERNDGLVGRSNHQPPMVEDMDVEREESSGSGLERPVSHLVAPQPPGRCVDPPVGPAIVPVLDPIQDPGPPRGSATAPVKKSSCFSKDGISAGGRIDLPTPASNEPYPNRAGVAPEAVKKRKWQGSEPDELISKRSCIESPVRERLDGTLKWTLPWHRTVSARYENSQVHGLRSMAASEELLAFLQRYNATGQPGNGDLPEATKLGHDPCTSPIFQEDSRFVQDKATRVSDRELQQQLSERNDGLVGRSNQQPPMVEDMDVVREESSGSGLERPVSHLVSPQPPDRSVDPPVGPTIVPVLDPIHDPGPPRDSATAPVNKRSCPSKDSISAAGRIGLPTPASNEPYPNRAGLVPEYQGESSDNIPACMEAPCKRRCLGLDSPRGFPLVPGGSASDNQGETICTDTELGSPAESPNDVNISVVKSADDFVFIVELVGRRVKCVHRRARGTIRPLLERHFRLRSKSGNFFNRDLRIVELDLSKNGATHMDIFFETEEVLVFQHNNYNEVNPTQLVRKIDQAVLGNKKAVSRGFTKHKYNLRARKRRRDDSV